MDINNNEQEQWVPAHDEGKTGDDEQLGSVERVLRHLMHRARRGLPRRAAATSGGRGGHAPDSAHQPAQLSGAAPTPAQRDGVADQHGDSVGTVPLDLRVEAAEEVAQPHETDGDDGDPHDIRHIARHAPKLEGAAGAGKVVWNGGKGKGWRKEQRIEDKGRRKEQRIEDEMV